MPEEPFQERTEKATPRRREEARQKGNVAKSAEINSVFILITGVTVLYLLHGLVFGQLIGVIRKIFENLSTIDISAANIHAYAIKGVGIIATILGPLVLSVAVIGIAVNYIQVGVLFTSEPLIPKLNKLDPVSGFKRLVSRRSLFELVKGIFKILIVGSIAYVVIKRGLRDYFLLVDSEVAHILNFVGTFMVKMILKIGVVLFVLAGLDYIFQKWDYERSIRMTKLEVKEEHKQAEGDPLIKSRIRSMQRQWARKRMMKAIPEANVVITNPTLLAVVLKYDRETMSAPRVVAKGARLLAERIKEIARQHDVPIVEDPPLAQALYKSVEIGFEIPYEFYKAVAEILSYVYHLKNISLF